MSVKLYEYCCECGDKTGRAGRGDDSLYIDDNGPYCEDCYEAEMTADTKLDALIARIEDGETLTREIDLDIQRAITKAKIPNDKRHLESLGFAFHDSSVHEEGYCLGVLPSWHSSFDAVMSLARNESEGFLLLQKACSTARVAAREPFNPEPVLRAMLVEALKARRT